MKIGLLLLSIGIVIHIIYTLIRNPQKYRLPVYLLLYFMSVWVINIAAIIEGYDWEDWPLVAFSSFLGTLQTFSLDAGYNDLWKGISAGCPLLLSVPCALNLMSAPVIGGAALLEILMGAFPRMKLFFRPWRRKFVFSELNEASITLAEDLYRDKNYSRIFFWDKAYQRDRHLRPLIIFTDAYPDKESENRSELFDRAKALRAVCIRGDILHLSLNHSKSVSYFLMDEDEGKNGTAIIGLLAGDEDGRLMWPVGEEEAEDDRGRKNREKRNQELAKDWAEDNKDDKIINGWKERNRQRLKHWRSAWKEEYGLSEDGWKEIEDRLVKAGYPEIWREERKGLKEKYAEIPEELLERMPAPVENPEPKMEDVPKDPRTKVYVFCQSDVGISLINRPAGDDHSDWGRRIRRNKEKVLIRPIRDYTHMAVMLMNDVPLFLPLLEKQQTNGTTSVHSVETGNQQETNMEINLAGFQVPVEKNEAGEILRWGGIRPTKDLHVTILGSGTVAEEVFKAVFWCGQMAGIQLHIHIMSKGAVEMKQRLRSRCPELLRSCREKDELLRIYPHLSEDSHVWKEPHTLEAAPVSPNTAKKKENHLYGAPYAIVDGFSEDVDAEDLGSYSEDILKKTDYYVVALGDDEKNLYVTKMLAGEIARLAMDSDEEQNFRPVIAPAVFDPLLAQSMRKMKPEKYMPYIFPFGTLEQRFGCRNVFLSDFVADALEGEAMYNRKTEQVRQKDEYSWWADLARSVHAPYKIYALGGIRKYEPLDPRTPWARCIEGHWEKLESRRDPRMIAFAWMGHRRWNAFLRTQGFSHATQRQHERLFREQGTHKEIGERKLHNCLVEGSMRGNEMLELHACDFPGYDALDMASIEKYFMECESNWDTPSQKGLQESEYKQYDEYDISAEDPTQERFTKSAASGVDLSGRKKNYKDPAAEKIIRKLLYG